MTQPGNRLVVHATVAMKWLIDEPGSDAPLMVRGADLVAPAGLRIGAGNVLRTLVAQGDPTAVQARVLFAFLQTAQVVIVDHDDDPKARALELALHLGHPIYDCGYLALARRLDRIPVTADARFLLGLAGSGLAAQAMGLEAMAAWNNPDAPPL